jgi:plasmid stability protein
MAQILVRNLDETLVKRLKHRAKADGRSLQSEVRAILERAVMAPVVQMKTARSLVERLRRKLKGRPFPDSVKLIREDRNR